MTVPNPHAPSNYKLCVARANAQKLEINLSAGEKLFVLGTNGSGKSSLMHLFYRENQDNVCRISAHRQTWFSSSAVSLSPNDKLNRSHHIRNTDIHPAARYKDDHAEARIGISIFDLISSENTRAREIAKAVDEDDLGLARLLSKHQSPLNALNELLLLSKIPIKICVTKSEEVLASRSGGPQYSIAELSDGERNALLLAANILTVKPGALVLIDEPERHLYRSINATLLTHLFNQRADCAFVVSTHDITLPLDHRDSQTLLVRNCVYNGGLPESWDLDLISADTRIDDELRNDILGARRKIIFIEGIKTSLDKPLYSLLFPGASVIPKENCRDVEHAVASLRDSQDLHWLEVFGIIDSDGRSEEDLKKLKAKGVYAIPCFSVESIYYHPRIQRFVVERLSDVTGDVAEENFSKAKDAAINAIKPHVERLAKHLAEKAIRAEIFTFLPRNPEFDVTKPIEKKINVPDIFNKEYDSLKKAIDDGDLDMIIRRYPIRETRALCEIAAKIGFKGRNQYETAVLKLLIDNADALKFVKSLVGFSDVELCGD